MKSRKIRWAGHVARMGHSLVGKPKGKRQLGKRRRRWEDNIRMDVTEIGWEGVVWIHLAQNRNTWQAPVNKLMNH